MAYGYRFDDSTIPQSEIIVNTQDLFTLVLLLCPGLVLSVAIMLTFAAGG